MNGEPPLRFRQAGGKIRRFWMSNARKSHVSSQHAKRGGQCKTCGQCCRILYKCPFLYEGTCVIYDDRFQQCRAFPIDKRDTKAVEGCGFYFE